MVGVIIIRYRKVLDVVFKKELKGNIKENMLFVTLEISKRDYVVITNNNGFSRLVLSYS